MLTTGIVKFTADRNNTVHSAGISSDSEALTSYLGIKNAHSIGFSGGRPLPFAIPLKLWRYSSILGHQPH
jgi:hypothetical protein